MPITSEAYFTMFSALSHQVATFTDVPSMTALLAKA